MKLIVFGSTGGIGRQVVAQALAAGHQVTAVARRPEMMTIQHERLQVVRGDIFEPASFQQALTGQDVVVSALGILTKAPTVFYSSSMSNIKEAMRASAGQPIRAGGSAGLSSQSSGGCMEKCISICCGWEAQSKPATWIGRSCARRA